MGHPPRKAIDVCYVQKAQEREVFRSADRGRLFRCHECVSTAFRYEVNQRYPLHLCVVLRCTAVQARSCDGRHCRSGAWPGMP